MSLKKIHKKNQKRTRRTKFCGTKKEHVGAKTCYPRKNTPRYNTVQNLLNALINILVKWHRAIILKTAGIATVTY